MQWASHNEDTFSQEGRCAGPIRLQSGEGLAASVVIPHQVVIVKGRGETTTPMNDMPLHDGPRPPEPMTAPPEHRVSRLVPFVHVDDVDRSVAFYHHLGFTATSVYRYRGDAVWAALQSEAAELMVTRDGDPIDPAGQGVLFYLYSPDLTALRAQLLASGVDAGEIADGTPGPREEMKVTDPDGYVLMIAQITPDDQVGPA